MDQNFTGLYGLYGLCQPGTCHGDHGDHGALFFCQDALFPMTSQVHTMLIVGKGTNPIGWVRPLRCHRVSIVLQNLQ